MRPSDGVSARARRLAREARALPSFAEFLWTQKFSEHKVEIERQKICGLIPISQATIGEEFMVELLSGIGLFSSGGIFLFLWYRDRKYPDQKKIGFGFVVMGALLILTYFMGWL